MVEFTPPDAVLPYLEGTPAGAHLMKQVAGIAGDTVCWDMTAMTVNGTVIHACLRAPASGPARLL